MLQQVGMRPPHLQKTWAAHGAHTPRSRTTRSACMRHPAQSAKCNTARRGSERCAHEVRRHARYNCCLLLINKKGYTSCRTTRDFREIPCAVSHSSHKDFERTRSLYKHTTVTHKTSSKHKTSCHKQPFEPRHMQTVHPLLRMGPRTTVI